MKPKKSTRIFIVLGILLFVNALALTNSETLSAIRGVDFMKILALGILVGVLLTRVIQSIRKKGVST